MVNIENYHRILAELKPYNASLVAVSKKKSAAEIKTLYDEGQRAFGENYIVELVEKQKLIPEADWNFIGHIQTNKLKSIIPFVRLIHAVDSFSHLREINNLAQKLSVTVDCLMQIHIAQEDTKFGFSYIEAEDILNNSEISSMQNLKIKGLMGMATATTEEIIIRKEFTTLKSFYDKYKATDFSILSMGMTSDYKIALDCGSNMVRIGSAIFGERA